MQWNYQLNKAKLTDLWVRNYDTITQVLILKFEFRLYRTFEKRAPELKCISSCHFWQREATISNYTCLRLQAIFLGTFYNMKLFINLQPENQEHCSL